MSDEKKVEKMNELNVEKVKEKNTKQTSEKPMNTKVILKTLKYTDEELTDLIRKKYASHDQYFKVANNIVNTICQKQLAKLNLEIANLEKAVSNPKNLNIETLNPFVIRIPIFMYNITSFLNEQALNVEISKYLNSREITEKLQTIQGRTEKERMMNAEYDSMISTFTLLIKTRVYANIKDRLEYATKIYDGIKKALSAQIEEMKIFGKDTNNK